MFRRSYITLVTAVTLLLLTIAPVYAAPSLSLGSTASYGITGRLAATESCSAVPVAFAGQACSGTTIQPPSNVTLNGAGSTFISPLVSAIATSYTNINPGVRINYQAVGSGTGVNDLRNLLVDFATSDAPLSSTQIAGIPETLTIPDTIGAVAVAYNLPGISSGLRLNVTVAAEIFQGQVTFWNDSRIQALNPGLALPFSPITIVHRSDSSGTTFVFSGYLNSSSVWKLGQSKTINWPAGSIGANGNQGVASVIQGTKYTVGYVELDYVLSASPPISRASLWNPAGGVFVSPSLNSTELAVSDLQSFQLPAGANATAWQSVSLLNSSVPGAYPIVSFSYIIVYRELSVYGTSMTLNRALALVQFLSYFVNGGQGIAPSVNYAPLPPNVVAVDNVSINSMTFFGQPPSIPPPAPPPPTSIEVALIGNVGWKVEGLSGTIANLLVSHQTSVSIPFGLGSFTPVTETGSFEQSIDLSTRIESPGAATTLVSSFLSSILPSLTGAGSSTSSTMQTLLASQSENPEYTQWWVNGPLALGTPVQILQGYGSTTGSEGLNLGGSIGARSGWIVTSQFSQALNLTTPNVGSLNSVSCLPSICGGSGNITLIPPPSSTVNANLNLLWSFDKNADLLLRSNDTVSLSMISVTPTTIYSPSTPCGTDVCTGIFSVVVTRNTAVTLNLAMLLSSTNLNLSTSKGHSASTLLDVLGSIPWMPVSLGVTAAGVISGLAVWFTKRARKSTSPAPDPSTTPPPIAPAIS